MEIYLIRHGESRGSSMEYYDDEKQRMNPPLTEQGMRQAEQLAARCASIGFDRIVASDLLRAEQTAKKIASVVPCAFSIDPAFREIHMGDLETKPWSDYPDWRARWVLHDEDMPYPNGESGGDVWNRCKTQLSQLVALPKQKIAIVCHGGTIRSIVCGVLGIAQQKRFCFGAPLEHCSITVIRYDAMAQAYCLHSFNTIS